ncbi:DNA-binding response regulator [Paenibacillus montaniterrae]|uniref:DNA-binding response regulator n=1 Tax=Paenibacillus montaniterrae TaxID=429341 RepID=A0A919YRX8_9BACL|nr:response regulator transcription factor [Paenibacillus montaniterrae]GIP18585.1 DNA-binding response regulator [Paenibacillus montaniterrae]
MKLLIVDDDSLVCRSLQILLGKEADIEVIGIASSGREALELCKQELPDAVLMDIQMPLMNGIACTAELKKLYPALRIMMLTTFNDEEHIRSALKAGADGYLLKSAAIETMANQLRALVSGTAVLDRNVFKAIIEPEHNTLDGLTEREQDIVECVAQGLSNKEISEKLYLSDGTVRNMLSIILDKLELRDRTQLAIYYWKRK